MRKIVLFIMTLMMVGSLFAYEPKKENVTVKRNGDFKYYEKTEAYSYSTNNAGEPNEDCVKWVIRKRYTVEQFVDYHYGRLESSRKGYYFSMEKAIDSNPDSFEIHITKVLNELRRTDESPKEHTTKSWLRQARKDRAWAVVALPFITEENYLTLTRDEMLTKMYAFIEECTNYNVK